MSRRPGAVAVAAVACFALAVCLREINNLDYWTHLGLGRAYVAAGTLVVPEPFRAVPADAPPLPGGAAALLHAAATAPGWPFQVGLHALRSVAGDAGVSILVAILAALTAALAAAPLLRERDPARAALGAAFVVAVIFVARFRFAPRPEAAAAVLLAATLALAWRWGDRPRYGTLLAIACLLVLWKPLHVTWALGAGLAGIAVAARPRLDFWRARPPAARAAAAALVAIAAVPAARFAWFVARELGGGGVLRGVTEMRPTWEFPQLLWPFLAVAGAGLGLAWGRADGRVRRLAVWVAAVAMGLVVVRNVAFAALALVPGALEGLAAAERAVPRRAAGWITAGAGALAVALGAVALSEKAPRAGVGVDWRYFPRASAEFVRDRGLESPVFNSWDWGGYLGWAWAGAPRTFLDGRLADAAKLEDHDAALSEEPRAVLERYGFRTVVLEPLFRNTGRLVPSLSWFLSSPEWRLVHAADALVFARTPLPPGVAEAPRAEVWRLVLAEAALRAEQGETAEHVPFTRAIALLELGDAYAARDAFGEGARRTPALAARYGELGAVIRDEVLWLDRFRRGVAPAGGVSPSPTPSP
jgi:hypothetical protein